MSGAMWSAGKPAATRPWRRSSPTSPAGRPRRLSSSRISTRSKAGAAAAVDGEAADQVGHRLHAVGVVGVVEQDAEGVLVVEVEPSGGLEEVGGEGAQALADVLDADAQA